MAVTLSCLKGSNSTDSSLFGYSPNHHIYNHSHTLNMQHALVLWFCHLLLSKSCDQVKIWVQYVNTITSCLQVLLGILQLQMV